MNIITQYEKVETAKKIKDSGSKRKFESGAVRDIQDGKGRCDLLPLCESISCLTNLDSTNNKFDELVYINNFIITGDTHHLINAIVLFSKNYFDNCYTMFLEVSKHFEDGGKKYGEHNWQKGIPTHSYIDSAIRHYLKYLRGDNDEYHDRAFIWNLLCCMWTCNNKPEYNDYSN